MGTEMMYMLTQRTSPISRSPISCTTAGSRSTACAHHPGMGAAFCSCDSA